MQRRLYSGLAGGLLGLVAAFPINASLSLSPAVAMIGCAGIGVVVGYVASIFFDVFTSNSEDESAGS